MGFSHFSDTTGTEGENVLVCIMILEGTLSKNTSASFLIEAPIEGNQPDTATGNIISQS